MTGLLLATVAVLAGVGVRPAVEPIPGRYIVVLREDARRLPVATRVRELAARHQVGRVDRTFGRLRGFAGEMSASQARRLARDPAVAWVEEDGVVHAYEVNLAGDRRVQTSPPWGLDRIDQWALPLSGSYAYGWDGTGVTVYVIDTGITAGHQDFGGRASIGYDAMGGTGADCNGHGTHVAGTVGGATFGVAKSVQLVAVRVLDCTGSGSISGVIAGVEWVTEHAQPPSAANMSLGGGLSAALDEAVRASIASGVVYAVAAGNGNRLGLAVNACNSSPSAVLEAVVVSASDATDTKAEWANYGPCVDLYAPGVDITSAWIGGPTATETISGTSMATPHVAGAAALYLQRHPTASPAEVEEALIGDAIPNAIADPKTEKNGLLYVGPARARPPRRLFRAVRPTPLPGGE